MPIGRIKKSTPIVKIIYSHHRECSLTGAREQRPVILEEPQMIRMNLCLFVCQMMEAGGWEDVDGGVRKVSLCNGECVAVQCICFLRVSLYTEAGVLKKLSLAGLAKLIRLRYS